MTARVNALYNVLKNHDPRRPPRTPVRPIGSYRVHVYTIDVERTTGDRRESDGTDWIEATTLTDTDTRSHTGEANYGISCFAQFLVR